MVHCILSISCFTFSLKAPNNVFWVLFCRSSWHGSTHDVHNSLSAHCKSGPWGLETPKLGLQLVLHVSIFCVYFTSPFSLLFTYQLQKLIIICAFLSAGWPGVLSQHAWRPRWPPSTDTQRLSWSSSTSGGTWRRTWRSSSSSWSWIAQSRCGTCISARCPAQPRSYWSCPVRAVRCLTTTWEISRGRSTAEASLGPYLVNCAEIPC